MGTWTSIEQAASRRWQTAYPGQETFLDLEYVVFWTPASAVDPFPGEGQLVGTASGVPKVRDRLPSAIYGSDLRLKSMVCRSVEFEPIKEATYTWRVVCRFSSFNVFTSDQGRYLQIQRQSGVRQTQVWRLGAYSAPTNVLIGSSDIGGDKIDINGNPFTYEVPTMQITTEYLVDRTYPAASPSKEPDTTTFATYIGKRNNATFLGCAVGTLVYQGFTVTPNYEYYRIQHQFLWDSWFHAEQFPLPIPTGAPRCLPGISVGGLTILQTEKVGWYQKYPSTAAIENVLDAAHLSEITTPLPAFP